MHPPGEGPTWKLGRMGPEVQRSHVLTERNMSAAFCEPELALKPVVTTLDVIRQS